MKTMKYFVSVTTLLPVTGAVICWLGNDYEHSKGLG